MTAAERESLVTDNIALAYFIAKPFFGRAIPHDDIESATLLGLTLAAKRFDPSAGYPFHVFARTTIRGTILTEINRLTHRGRALELLTELDSDEASGQHADPAETAALLDRQIDARTQTARLTMRLDRRSRRLIQMYFGREMTMRQISEREGISMGYVSVIISRALATMREPAETCPQLVRRRVVKARSDAKRRKQKRAA